MVALLLLVITGEVTKESWLDHNDHNKEFIPSQEQLDAYKNKLKVAGTADGGMEI